jgi:hypothetical protein
MPNEFIVKNGLISQGNITGTGSLVVSQNITASNISASATGSFNIVGIGTTIPSNSKLHIYGDHISGHSILKVQTSSSLASGGVSSLAFFDSDGSRNTLLYAASDGTYLANEVAKPIYFSTNGTQKMTITSGGNVGIGTTSVNFKLDMWGATGTTLNMANVDDVGRGGKLTFISSSATGSTIFYWNK